MAFGHFFFFAIWAESLAAAYIGVILVSVHDCDKRIDPLAANPFEPALLFGPDLIAAAIYGSALAVTAYGLSLLMRRTWVAMPPLAQRLMYVAPLGITAIAVAWVYAGGPPATPGCRP